eukprot:COSAG05_NODE_2586_length_2871_cov_21.775758_2_plen_69_part_00
MVEYYLVWFGLYGELQPREVDDDAVILEHVKNEPVTCCGFSADGRWVATGSADDVLRRCAFMINWPTL